MLNDLMQAMRPRQWLKNGLVVLAPLAAGSLFEWPVLLATSAAFVAFVLVSSATYLINDVVDRNSDREHPVKQSRPIASGEVSSRVAVIVAVVLIGAGIALAFVTRPALGWVVVVYVASTLVYSLWLKHAPVAELVLLALGFLLRAIAGGAATGIPLSSWFLLVAGFGSLFVAAGKRYSEMSRISAPRTADNPPGSSGRRSLDGYTPTYLRFVWTMAAAVTVVMYSLWAVEVAGTMPVPWAVFSILPFTLGLLRYGVDVDRGDAEAPEDAAFKDPSLVVAGVAWVVLFGLGAAGVG